MGPHCSPVLQKGAGTLPLSLPCRSTAVYREHSSLATRGQKPCLACRERRKQRFSDMEHVIDDLSAQLSHMSDVSSQNAALQVRQHLGTITAAC